MLPRVRRRLLAAASPLLALTLSLGAAAEVCAAPPVSVASGDMIRLAQVEFGCTIGFLAPGSGVAFTAGHCGSPSWTGHPAYRDYGLAQPIGTTVFLSQRADLDYAAIRLRREVRPRPSAGALRRDPKVGDRLCKLGRVTGFTCGTVSSVSGTQIRVRDLLGFFGDSGALGTIDGRAAGLVRGFDVRWVSGIAVPGDAVLTRLDAIERDAGARGLLRPGVPR